MSLAEPIPDTSLRWTVHPAAESPGRAVLLALIVLLASLFAAAAVGSLSLGLLAALLLLVSVRAYFLPRSYELDEAGAREHGPLCAPRSLSWREVRRITAGRFGVHLSPRYSDSRLIRDRGLFLRTRGNRSEVQRFAEQHLGAS